MKRILFALALMISACSESDNTPTVKATQLKSQTTFFETQTGDFRPAEKNQYFYNSDGKLVKEEQLVYDIESKTFGLYFTAIYSYNDGKLKNINKTLTDYAKTIITTFEYSDDRVSKIHNDDNVDTDATITYLPQDKVEIVYNLSNGRNYTYRFTLVNNNIEFEQTAGDDGQLDTETVHEYDDKNNPLLLLGYTDIFFSNISRNNRIKTDNKFFSDQKPQSVPISYVYAFNELNYPTEVIITYQSTGDTPDTRLLKTIYEYN